MYRAATVEQAEEALKHFEETWDSRYPMISKSWRSNWSRIIPFFSYSEDIRKVIYTTNAIESLNNSLRKVTKNRNSFPSDEAALKLLYMALKNIVKKWTMPVRNWSQAIHQFSILFEGTGGTWETIPVDSGYKTSKAASLSNTLSSQNYVVPNVADVNFPFSPRVLIEYIT